MAEEKAPSYLRAMLSSQGNLYAGLGALAAATVVSIPFGLGIGAIPLLAFAAGEIIAAMYVPSLSHFRDKVDREWRNRERTQTRQRLLAEIEARGARSSVFKQTMTAFSRMSSQVDSLYSRAGDSQSRLSSRDVERLDDATIEFLYIWLALLVMDERGEAVKPREIEDRIDFIDREIAAPKPGTDLRQLHKARVEYVAVLERHHRMLSRKRALDAALFSMPGQIEEIYQTIMTTPLSEEFGSRLEESITRLRLQEDIEAELAGDIAEAVPGFVAQSRQAASAAPAPRLAAVASVRQARTSE
jgi:hypothetical protein